MEKVLFVNGCVRPASRTHILAKEVLAKLPGTAKEVHVQKEGIAPLTCATLEERDAYVHRQDYSSPIFKYAKQFAQADTIVVAAPYWDLSFPAAVKAYFEAVTVCGITFAYTEDGRPKGLCKAKKLIYITTAGGPISKNNYGYEYVKAVASTFYGIPTTLCYTAENLDIKGADVEQIMQQAIKSIQADDRI